MGSIGAKLARVVRRALGDPARRVPGSCEDCLEQKPVRYYRRRMRCEDCERRAR
jgi:hypothetical protein